MTSRTLEMILKDLVGYRVLLREGLVALRVEVRQVVDVRASDLAIG